MNTKTYFIINIFFSLTIINGSYAIGSSLILAYSILQKRQKTLLEYETIENCFKIHSISMFINIYCDLKEKTFHSIIPLSSAFVLIYNYCSSILSFSSLFDIISIDELLLI